MNILKTIVKCYSNECTMCGNITSLFQRAIKQDIEIRKVVILFHIEITSWKFCFTQFWKSYQLGDVPHCPYTAYTDFGCLPWPSLVYQRVYWQFILGFWPSNLVGFSGGWHKHGISNIPINKNHKQKPTSEKKLPIYPLIH